MERRALVRASDADREQVAERLQTAATEGRLTPEEFEERLHRTYASRTYGELDRLLADLPAPVPARRSSDRSGAPKWVRPALVTAALVALLNALTWHGRVERGPGSGVTRGISFHHPHPAVGILGAATAGLMVLLMVAIVGGWILMRASRR